MAPWPALAPECFLPVGVAHQGLVALPCLPNTGVLWHMPKYSWLPQAIVMATHSWILGWQEPIFPYAFRGQWGGVVISPSSGLAPCHGNLERGAHFPGKFLMVFHIGDCLQLSPPGWHAMH